MPFPCENGIYRIYLSRKSPQLVYIVVTKEIVNTIRDIIHQDYILYNYY